MLLQFKIRLYNWLNNLLLEFFQKKTHKKSTEMINEVYDKFFKLGQMK
jgi:hypothetical protein